MAHKSGELGVTSGTSESRPTNSAMDASSMIQEITQESIQERLVDGVLYGGVKVAHRQMCGLTVSLRRNQGGRNGSG